MSEDVKPNDKMKFVSASGASASGLGSGVLIIWAWNGWAVPAGAPEMDPEVAGAVAMVSMAAANYLVSFLPKPPSSYEGRQ